MLTIDDMAEKTQRQITIHEIEPDAMQQLVEYSYVGSITITEENVQASVQLISTVCRQEALITLLLSGESKG